MEAAIVVIVIIAIFALIFVGLSVKVLREYERGVIFRLGRLIATKGPGLILLIPLIDRMVKVDLRTVTLTIPPQEVITRDNVPTSVNAVAYFRVVDSNRAIVEVENFLLATSQIAQTALRSVLGKAELDQLLAERERLNEELQKIIDESTEPWGVKVTAVEIKDVEIPEQMQRAMARQAEAERERRAKIINSEGEYQAAQKLTDAADIISTNPASLQLRYLQTLLEIGSNENTTVVFPLPIDLLEPFLEVARANRAATPTGPRPAPEPPPEEPEDLPPPAEDEALSAPEIRIDQLTGLRTILAPGRAERPEGFNPSRSEEKGPEGCPFCEGSEAKTPPEVYAVRPGGGDPDSPGWTSRVVPNLYPALEEGEDERRPGDLGRGRALQRGRRPAARLARGRAKLTCSRRGRRAGAMR